MFTSPSQILISCFGLNIYYYGVILALAIVSGVLFSDWIATKFYDLKKETIIDAAPYLIISGIIGARLYYCLLNSDFYLKFPTEILAVRHGGISIHGAIIGGFIGLYIFARRKNYSLLKLADISAPGLALAQSIGRWGNFFNSEAFGLPTNLPWKLYIAPQYRPIPYQNYEFFHPTFLYESIFDLIIFIILFLIIKKKTNLKSGNIACIYLIIYSFVRIFTESLRLDSAAYICSTPVAIIMSLIIIVISAITLLKINSKGQ